MKTNFFKSVLPVFAVLVAVGFSFATESVKVYQEAYYNHPSLGWQSVVADPNCGVSGNTACTFQDIQLYSQPSYGSTALRKN